MAFLHDKTINKISPVITKRTYDTHKLRIYSNIDLKVSFLNGCLYLMSKDCVETVFILYIVILLFDNDTSLGIL